MYEDEPEETPQEAVEIYPKWAIRGFAIFFGTIFGGVLLMLNLRRAGYKKAAVMVLVVSIIYTVISAVATSFISHNPGSMAGLVFNIIGALMLADYFFPRYFPDNDYYPKSIWNALGISILINITFFLVLYYSGYLPELKAMIAK